MHQQLIRQSPILSIIIPAYNVSAYIRRCLHSVLDAAEGEVEVLLVDDGSTDDTLEVARQSDPTGRCIFITQQNAGLGSARNAGLAQARGDFVWFVDGDDWLKPGAIAQVLRRLQEARPDVLVVDFTCADEAGETIQWIHSPFKGISGHALTGGGFFARYHATTYAVIYVIRRQLMLDHGLRFQPRINMQDAELIPRLMAVASHVVISGIDAYVYVKRAGSFINSREPEVRERYFESVLEVRRRLREFLITVSDPLLRAGMQAKLEGLQRILLMAYVYEVTDATQLRGRLGRLRSEGAHPLPAIHGESLKDGLLRRAINVSPVLFPLVFRWLRLGTAGIRTRWLRSRERVR